MNTRFTGKPVHQRIPDNPLGAFTIADVIVVAVAAVMIGAMMAGAF